ncbi:MAG: ribokinase [Capsulimonadaceae bacterium]|nr:ribokinase [Capsulimonadaceae bacterium]
MSASRIVVVGSTNTDMIFRSPRIPDAGETLLGAMFAMAAGGKGANQAVAAARLGGNVTFVARVGADDLGRASIQGFQKDGIDTRYIVIDQSASSGVAAILVDQESGQNRIIVASGANARLTIDDVRAATDAIREASVVVCQLETPLDVVEEALTIAHRHGVPTILNPAPAQSLPARLFPLITYLTPNEIEAAQLVGGVWKAEDASAAYADLADKLRSRGVDAVIVTLGADGCFVLDNSGSEHIPGRRVDKIVDTTAAGDCFTGALAVRLGEGAPLPIAIDFANRAAALSVGRAGAQPSLPYRAELEAR